MVGHSLGAIGAIEMAACALAIEHGVVPPTANWANRDPECDLDYTPNTAREHKVDVALSVGSGFGGFQSAMVFRSLTRSSRHAGGLPAAEGDKQASAPNGLPAAEGAGKRKAGVGR